MPLNPLTPDAVGPTDTEWQCTRLLNAFYKSYFDGNDHVTTLGTLNFPRCEIVFGQATPANALPVLHTIFHQAVPKSENSADADGSFIQVTVRSIQNLFVRAANDGSTDNQPEFLCRDVADRIANLYGMPLERGALVQKGILDPRILSGPTVLAMSGYQVRMFVLRMDLRYRIPSVPRH